jgi:uncharacterized protein
MSPRCKKPRTCGCHFKGKAFKPTGIPLSELDKIILYIDELEAFKLCDYDGLTQNEAGSKMGVSRGTVQRLLSSARGKIAAALSECKAILLEETLCKPKGGTQ